MSPSRLFRSAPPHLRCLAAFTLLWAAASEGAAQDRPVALVGARILPIASEPVDDGVLVVQGGRVVAVGPRGSVSIPGDAEVRDVTGLWIMPGLVDTHSHLGRTDGADRSFPMQPEARVLDGLDARDPGIRKAMAGGLTTVNIMPGSGHLISGQTAYVKLRGAATVDGLLFCEDPLRDICGGLKMANGTNPMGAPPFPGTRGRAAALVREEFRKAVEYRDRVRSGEQEPSRATSRDLRMELLSEVLDGRRIVHMHSHRHDDILSALRLQEEFGYRLVLHHLSDGHLVADEIAANGASASIVAPDAPGGKEEALNASFAAGAVLEQAGVPVAFHTDDGITDSRFFRRLGGMYVRHGMSREGALEALTLAGARMLGLEDRVGSLEAGKDADFILLDGDPLSVYTHVQETWVEGRKVFDLSDPEDRAFAVGGGRYDPGFRGRLAPGGWTMSRMIRGVGALARRGTMVLAAVCSLVAPAHAQVAVRGDVVHTVSGEPIVNGVVLIGADGRIEAVGPFASVSLPAGIRVLQAAVVTPGLVDAHTVVGLSGILGGTQDQEQLERSAPIQPQLRALDAYNPREPLVEWVRNLGTTTIHTGHGPGALVSGQTMLVKTTGSTLDGVLVDSLTAYAATVGAEAVGAGGGWPGTRARAVVMLRSFLLRARESLDRGDADGADLALLEGRRILRGEVPLMITAHRVPDILTALRLQDEFGFRLILDGAAEVGQVLEEVRSSGVPVILHPTMARHQGPLEQASFETALRLHEAGIPFAIPSGFEPYFPKTRVLLMEAAMAAGYGLPFERTLRAITLDPAGMLGVSDRVGSLEVGKDGDVVLFDGDPFEFTTRVCGVLIEGEIVSETCR